MICTDRLTKTYRMDGANVCALDHVSLHIGEGEYAAIIGPSGSGKSTLMHILGCLDVPTRGRYYLHGRDVSALPAKELARVRTEAALQALSAFGEEADGLRALANSLLTRIF